MLVRTAELACRTSWGTDQWEPRPEDFAIHMEIWGPYPSGDFHLDDLPADLLRHLIGDHDSSAE